ncbi:LysR family transcriptional regulator [Stenotrophomonas maltophilia]|uniref:LysR family transcriptional regulator n=1 Tax=Stenotrophomonas maltophilia TaxID=40324 RepID=A0A2W6I481_STEMA|nr:LysR family transcriptional regulator [Stenotrophomonas maltophilia]PZS90560.1 LysR family transcriptional regulator [Stenotrophomonas maltophilia]
MELRHLRYFVMTAQLQNFTKAAEALHIAQPPLGQQIRALEEEIGTPLFHRQGRGIVLSDAGRVFWAAATDILARVEQAKQDALRAARGEVGTLTLGLTESASFNEAVTALLRRFQQAHPAVQLHLVEDGSESLVRRLDDGELDAVIVRPPYAPPGERITQQLSAEPLVAVLPADHPLAGRTRIALAELRDERFILFSRKSGYGLSADVVAACRSQGFTPAIQQEAPQVASAINLAAAGLGIAIVPASMQNMHRPGLCFVALELGMPLTALQLVVRGDPPAAAAQLLSCSKEAAQAHSP